MAKEVMNKAQILALNATKLATAIGGKKGLCLPLLECLRHAEKHGDYTVCTDVINSWKDAECNFTHEAKAAISWFVKYGGLTYDNESKAFTGWKGATHIRDNFQDAKANPYYNGITIAKDPEFDLDVEIGKLVSKANKMMKVKAAADVAGKTVNIVINPDHMEALKILQAA